jgi:hypothetical protein
MRTLITTSDVQQPVQLSSEQPISEGWQMAETEGEAVFESIDIRHSAELHRAEVEAKHIEAKGHTALRLRDAADAKLRELGFDLARHLSEMARGRIDLLQAIALFIVSAALALFVLMAFGPALLSVLLALAIAGSVASIEEFFEAHNEHHTVHESIFLVISMLGLAGQFWLGLVRGRIMTAVADSGPVSHMLSQAGPILQYALGILAMVVEVLCGWKFFRARQQLLSPGARAFRERELLNVYLAHLGRSLEATKAAPEVNRRYRTIGARQQIAWSRSAEQRAHATHLSRAVKGALIALAVIAAFLFFASRMFGATIVRRNDVALLDLSKSVTPQSFRANADGIAALIGTLQCGDRLLVIPITDGFTDSILLDESMPIEAGYLGLQQQSARETVAAKWRDISLKIRPTYGKTDVISALTSLSYRNVTLSNARIYIFSDLEQCTRTLDLQHVETIAVELTLARLRRTNSIPDLRGAEILALGVDPIGKSTQYYATLRSFWLQFFKAAGAELKAFTIDRSIPEY